VFESAEVIDRQPPPPGSYVMYLEPARVTIEAGKVKWTVTRNRYPSLPARDFARTPDVETLWQRYVNYREGREPLLAMAYFCLDMIETLAGGRRNKNKRKAAAAKFGVGVAVLDKLGELTSSRGDTATARKGGVSGPLTPAEQNWIETTIRKLIRRVGEIAGGAKVRRIQLEDPPSL
jgi:hypothetical protein